MHARIVKRIVPFSLLFTWSFMAGCSFPNSHTTQSTETTYSTQAHQDFDTFTGEFFRTEIESNTINLHFTLADPESYGITETPITLGSISEETMETSAVGMENTLSILEDFDYQHLSVSQQLTWDVLDDYLKTELSASDLALCNEPLRPSTGIQAQLPVLYEEYRFYDKEDVEDYLALLPLTDKYFGQIIEFERAKAAAGLFMSDFACDDIISQCETFAENPDSHYLIETFNKKIDQLASLSANERENYKLKNESIVKEHVLPAYDQLADALTLLLGSGTNDKGLCYLENGSDYYEYLVRYCTGSDKTIPKIQEMIEQQRLSDLNDSATLIAENPGIWEKCNAVSLEETDSIATLNALQSEMLKNFPEAPDTNFTVSYIDECMEDYMAPAFYITAPIDNYENNSIFINAMTDTTTMRYFTTLAHEGFPGHLYQTVMSYEAGIAPVRSILNYPGYVEGWATYVEMLSYQYAGLDESVADLLSLNQSALLSLYASTDLGIHHDGWSYSDTVKFWAEYGISDAETIRQIYDLIVEEPAHYLKYYVGYVEFLELKNTAKERYGSNYSDVAFHQAVLDIGPAPFGIIEKYLDQYYVTAD